MGKSVQRKVLLKNLEGGEAGSADITTAAKFKNNFKMKI